MQPVNPTGWDTFLLMMPFLAMLILGMLGLDERFAAPASQRPRRRRFCQADGMVTPTDPDGKPWKAGVGRRQPAAVRGVEKLGAEGLHDPARLLPMPQNLNDLLNRE